MRLDVEHTAVREAHAAGGSQRGVLLGDERAGAADQPGAVVVAVLAVRRGELVPARAIELMVRVRHHERLHTQRLLQRAADSLVPVADSCAWHDGLDRSQEPVRVGGAGVFKREESSRCVFPVLYLIVRFLEDMAGSGGFDRA